MDRPEPETDTCVCTALRQAARHVSQHYDAALGAFGVSANQYAILTRLGRCGPSTINALAALLVMDRSTLGHLLRPLEARGLVRLAPAIRDRRAREISLTEAGRSLVEAAQPLWHAAQASFERAYGAPNAKALRAELRHVATTDFKVATTDVKVATPDVRGAIAPASR